MHRSAGRRAEVIHRQPTPTIQHLQMKQTRAAILLAVLTIISIAFTQCYAAPSDNQQLGEHDAARGAKTLIQELSEVTDRQNMENDLSDTITTRMDQLYEQVAKQLDNQRQEEENGVRGRMYTQADKEMDMEEELKQMMLTKMKEMYDKAMSGDMSDFVNQKQPQEYSDSRARMEELVESFLSKKIGEIKTSEVGEENNADATVESETEARIMSDGYRYLPVFKFDRANKCYPDWPSSQNNNKCRGDLNPHSPVFCQLDYCEGYIVYTYWLWYGFQEQCIEVFDSGHGDDWEHVSVYVDRNNGQVAKVVFHQHDGHYTRRRGTYDTEGDRPVVYVGKIAHGSYHAHCDGHCTFTEFFTQGCLGSVNYCQGGCLYWDDFRNPGPALRNANIYPLRIGQTVDGIKRPSGDKTKVCSIGTCEGASHRAPASAGCWKNEP